MGYHLIHEEDVSQEALEAVLWDLNTTIQPGAPRAISDFVAHAEVPDAVRACRAHIFY